jgi:hypothetical protein
MKPIEFKEQNVVFGKDQPEYIPLPALRFEGGTVVTCWKLSWKEAIKVLFMRKIWHSMLTFNNPLQPTLLITNKEELITTNKEE